MLDLPFYSKVWGILQSRFSMWCIFWHLKNIKVTFFWPQIFKMMRNISHWVVFLNIIFLLVSSKNLYLHFKSLIVIFGFILFEFTLILNLYGHVFCQISLSFHALFFWALFLPCPLFPLSTQSQNVIWGLFLLYFSVCFLFCVLHEGYFSFPLFLDHKFFSMSTPFCSILLNEILFILLDA